MSEYSNPDPNQPSRQSLGEELGIPADGNFLVKRSNGVVETGWGLGRVVDAVDKQGLSKRYAVIVKQENGQAMQKTVPVTELLSWQVSPEDSDVTVNRENLNQLKLTPDADEIISPPTPREEALFSPVVIPENEKDSDESDYDDYVLGLVEAKPVEAAAVRPSKEVKGREIVSAETKQVAERVLEAALRHDEKFRSILERAIGEVPQDMSAETPVDRIRQDASVRLALGRYFLNKTHAMANSLPDRVKRNTQKNPNYAGYGNFMSSREYVALLCLSMIDGTFDTSREDEVVFKNGQVELGQHREAARDVLFSAAVE